MFIDLLMPDMDGLEATRQIHRIAGGGDPPILAMTANAFTEDREACLKAGMNDFLTKPVAPETLFGIALRLTSRRRRAGGAEDTAADARTTGEAR